MLRPGSTPHSVATRRRRRAAFTLIEVCVALFILTLALGALIGSVFWGMKLEGVNEQTSGASQLARAVLEDLAARPFRELFATFNANPADDPDPLADPLAELLALEPKLAVARKGGPTIRILFPGDGLTLREDVEDARLGMPRDLDGDGAITADDQAGDYRILPLTVRIEWAADEGARAFEVSTLLRER